MQKSGVKISFGFKKKVDTKLLNVPVEAKNKEEEEVEYINTIENKNIKGVKKVSSFGERLIPMTNNRNAKEPTLENYVDIPVEEFGLAMVKGMNWSEDDPDVKPIESSLRPKGAGLGHKFA